MWVIGRSDSSFSGDVGVEQQDRHPADLRHPHGDDEVASGQLDA